MNGCSSLAAASAGKCAAAQPNWELLHLISTQSVTRLCLPHWSTVKTHLFCVWVCLFQNTVTPRQRATVSRTQLLITSSVGCLSQHNVLSVTTSDAAATWTAQTHPSGFGRYEQFSTLSQQTVNVKPKTSFGFLFFVFCTKHSKQRDGRENEEIWSSLSAECRFWAMSHRSFSKVPEQHLTESEPSHISPSPSAVGVLKTHSCRLLGDMWRDLQRKEGKKYQTQLLPMWKHFS